MRQLSLPIALFLLVGCVAIGCKKEVKVLNVRLEAKCRDCVVQYAGGVDRAKADTLWGSVDPDSGDSIAQLGNYELELSEGENLFFRACRMSLDTAYGDIELRAEGDIRSLNAAVGTDRSCATINETAQPQ